MDLNACVTFARKLIQIESLPGEEEEIARVVAEEMRTLGYPEVRIDEAGNVIGKIPGEGNAPDVMFNTHLDHVDVGDPRNWPYPPFAGHIEKGRLWGRGAMDIKGPLAAQVHGVASILGHGNSPPAGNVYVTAVVQEEIGGLGARHLVKHLKPELVVIGESTRNRLYRGHRGRTELLVHVKGRSVHASVPESGANPLAVIGRFLQALETIEHPSDVDLGPSSVAPTLIRTDQTSPNVVPGECWLTCDWRNIPGQSGEEVREILERLVEGCLVPGTRANVSIPSIPRVSYTGLKMEIPADNPAFILPAEHPAVRQGLAVLESSIGLEEPASVWKFATDGGHFAPQGLSVVGFGPGEEELAHTVDESIELTQLEQAMQGNRDLALYWPRRVGGRSE